MFHSGLSSLPLPLSVFLLSVSLSLFPFSLHTPLPPAFIFLSLLPSPPRPPPRSKNDCHFPNHCVARWREGEGGEGRGVSFVCLSLLSLPPCFVMPSLFLLSFFCCCYCCCFAALFSASTFTFTSPCFRLSARERECQTDERTTKTKKQ